MSTPTHTETVNPAVVRSALLTGATFLDCSIWRPAGEKLAESRARLGSHPLGNAARGRDAP